MDAVYFHEQEESAKPECPTLEEIHAFFRAGLPAHFYPHFPQDVQTAF